jgi:hypothetical protein
MFWNCNAARMVIQDPPGDEINWSIGCISPVITGIGDATTEPIGTVQSQGTHIAAIPSLFMAQLNERLGALSNNQIVATSFGNTLFIDPNPAKTQITIYSLEAFNSIIRISIYSITGQLVKNQKEVTDFSDNKLSFKYDVTDLVEGIYFAEILNNNICKTIMFIVKK